MKLITYLKKNKPRLAVLTEDTTKAVDLISAQQYFGQKRNPEFSSLLSFISNGEKARDTAEDCLQRAINYADEDFVFELSDIELMAPMTRPASIRDFMSFEDHIINCIRREGLKKLGNLDDWIEEKFGREYSLAKKLNGEFYKRPLYYKGNTFSVCGPESEIKIPQGCKRFDYELEFGIFIAKKGKNIPYEEAKDYIAGYTLFNDFSDRTSQLDEQKGRLGPAKGKDFDNGNAMGPWFVTADEIPNLSSLELIAKVNGEEWSRCSAAEMHWSFEQMIEYVSKNETLHPGEFFGSGTCSNMRSQGCGLEHGKFLKAGDEIEISAMQLGVLKNRIIA